MTSKTICAALVVLCLGPGVLRAQTPTGESAPQTSVQGALRDQLMPASASVLAPAPTQQQQSASIAEPSEAAYARRGAGTGFMIAGLALFVGGLIAGGDAGTFLIVGGAVLGAYGLILHFQ